MPWYNSVTGEHVYSPSDDDKQRDELVYKPSIYAKEELPTWAEVYEEFYLGKRFIYDPNNPNGQIEDHYWNIPHNKFLIAVVCNQFNKMLYEDGMMDNICKKVSDKLNLKVKSLQFICGDKNKSQMIYKLDSELSNKFFEQVYEIYTIPLPTGKENPFIISKYNRVNINKLDGLFALYPILNLSHHNNEQLFSTPNSFQNIFYNIIEIMIEMYKNYFEGDIGWKDSKGNLIEGDPGHRNCTGAGYITK